MNLSSNIYADVPTYTDGQWDVTTFYSREEFRDFVRSIFKDAGPDEGYELTVNVSKQFNVEARLFQKQGYY
jgi:hypothetical protein